MEILITFLIIKNFYDLDGCKQRIATSITEKRCIMNWVLHFASTREVPLANKNLVYKKNFFTD